MTLQAPIALVYGIGLVLDGPMLTFSTRHQHLAMCILTSKFSLKTFERGRTAQYFEAYCTIFWSFCLILRLYGKVAKYLKT